MALGLAFGLAFGLTAGLAEGLAFSLTLGLVGGLTFGLMGGLTFGLMEGLAAGGGFAAPWILLYFRFPVYLLALFKTANANLQINPYRKSGALAFELPGLREQLMQQAFEAPEAGEDLSRFLFKRRPFQEKTAIHLKLAAIAGDWMHHRLQSQSRKFPELKEVDAYYYEYIIGNIRYKLKILELPTEDWLPAIQATRAALIDYEQETNVWRRVEYFEVFMAELDTLYATALRQPKDWGKYFVQALERWQKTATERLEALKTEAITQEPVARNIYRAGEKLRLGDQELFVGREDLRNRLKTRVVTAQAMPLFFIQGQRRVGKSSLITFLPRILDSGFKVVAYDMQEKPGLSLPQLLGVLHERVYQGCLLPLEEAPAYPESWLEAWQLFRDAMDNAAQAQSARIVLAIDEYEALHVLLQSDPAQGDALLAAMRAYAQAQNRFVFLFSGSDFFSELRGPNWADYFVQAERLYVDYLDQEAANKLIQLCDLSYPQELLERMWYDTQGHPCLLQKICRDVVAIVNDERRTSRKVTMDDYEVAYNAYITDRDDGVINVFWMQFCENRGLKDTVRQILNGEKPDDAKAILTLEDHRFIVGDAAKGWRMRVPIFEHWLQRYKIL